MPTTNNATPLIALDAMVIDTETTGLDPAKARIVEIGAVPLTGGKLDEQAALRRLIHPGQPIPSVATQIHHIDDAAVAAAPRFAAAWPEVAAAISGSILIGHALGFDLAVLKRECELAGLPWAPPRTLDTRLLAEVAEPHLGGYSLEHLASWLGVTVEGRHSAVADATLTARIFLALLPKLREGNIRTLAEAEQACLALTGVLEDQHRAGWEQTVVAPQAREQRALARIDSYAYRHRVADVMSAPPKSVAADVSLADALQRMAKEKVSSLLVTSLGAGPVMRARDTAIVTERDVLRALSEQGAQALNRPVARCASKPLITVPAAAFVYRALGRMSRLKLRHLGVENDDGEVCGIVTSRDLLRLRAQDASILGDALDQADDVPSLAAAWARLPQAASGLIAEGVGARVIAAVISRELGALTRRAGVLAERRMAADGQGGPPCAYALCVLGSAGRGESLLAMDQDNAIVFADGAPGEAADRWFAQFGAIVADILHEVGVPYCKGGVMAQERRLARLGRDLARAHRRLDRALGSGRPACRSTSSSIWWACMATSRSPMKSGAPASMPRAARRRSPSCWRKRPARCSPASRFGAASIPRTAASISSAPACSASSPPRACWRSAITCSSARPRRGSPPSAGSTAAAGATSTRWRARRRCSSSSFSRSSSPTCAAACRRATRSRSGG